MDDPNKRRKITVYLLPALLREIQSAAQVHDRSASWIVRRAWLIARAEIGRLPARRRAPGDGAGNAA
ncbi:MAG TPA: TIGR04563 family protein [Polyangia bacterium]|nr:TIGR04563 family protein [Polyangia bacterium]